jgi:hypothetical protein
MHHHHCEVAIHLTDEEMDALLSLLLCAPESEEVDEAMAQRLLLRVAEAQRTNSARRSVQSEHAIVD